MSGHEDSRRGDVVRRPDLDRSPATECRGPTPQRWSCGPPRTRLSKLANQLDVPITQALVLNAKVAQLVDRCNCDIPPCLGGLRQFGSLCSVLLALQVECAKSRR